MKYLVYCIFKSPKLNIAEIPVGIDGCTVHQVEMNGFCAAVSLVSNSSLTPSISGLLAYERTVESIQHCRTLVPMRFGSVFEGESQVSHFLEEQSTRYGKLLKELDGCIEMGIRVLFEADPDRLPYAPSETSDQSLSDSNMPGSSYLAARRARYDTTDRVSDNQKRIVEKICRGLSGFFLRSKLESSKVSGRCILSIYFLVPGGGVESFRAAFGSMPSMKSAPLLMSGPWPPYNFVTADKPFDALSSSH